MGIYLHPVFTLNDRLGPFMRLMDLHGQIGIWMAFAIVVGLGRVLELSCWDLTHVRCTCYRSHGAPSRIVTIRYPTPFFCFARELTR